MSRRATAAAATGQRIHAAARALFLSRDYEDVTLQAIAEHAEVTLQTVLRRFGSKEQLATAVAEAWSPDIAATRDVAVPGDSREAIRRLVASYEELGAMNWRMLRMEHRVPLLHARLDEARALHRAWLERTFAPALPRRGRARERLVLRLFAATDVYVWKLLRTDLGLPRAEVEHLMGASVEALLRDAAPAPGARRPA